MRVVQEGVQFISNKLLTKARGAVAFVIWSVGVVVGRGERDEGGGRFLVVSERIGNHQGQCLTLRGGPYWFLFGHLEIFTT